MGEGKRASAVASTVGLIQRWRRSKLLVGAAISIAAGLFAMPAAAFLYIGGNDEVPLGVHDIDVVVTLTDGFSFNIDIPLAADVHLGETNLQLVNYTKMFGNDISSISFVAWTVPIVQQPIWLSHNGPGLPIDVPPVPVGATDAKIGVYVNPDMRFVIDVPFDPSVDPGFTQLYLSTLLGEDPADIEINWISWTEGDNPPLEVANVPEPATWTMMILGFGALGAVLRTRRRARLAA